MKVTIQDINYRVEYLNRLVEELGILEGDKWEDIPEHLKGTRYEYPHLVLEQGSQTYGRAWRLNGSGGSKYQTAHFDPLRLGSGYLGWTKAEVYNTLNGLISGISLAQKALAQDVRQEAGK